MTLYELGCEYDKAVETLTWYIQHATEEKKKAEAAGEAQRAYEIRLWLAELYAQRKDTREIADKLKNYYATTTSGGVVT